MCMSHAGNDFDASLEEAFRVPEAAIDGYTSVGGRRSVRRDGDTLPPRGRPQGAAIPRWKDFAAICRSERWWTISC